MKRWKINRKAEKTDKISNYSALVQFRLTAVGEELAAWTDKFMLLALTDDETLGKGHDAYS